MPRICISVVAGLILSACAGLTPTGVHDTGDLSDGEAVDQIRFTHLVSWHVPGEGRVQVEVANPRRQYLLKLEPTCTFALREVEEIRFDGRSSHHIAIGDSIVAGRNRCRITEILSNKENL